MLEAGSNVDLGFEVGASKEDLLHPTCEMLCPRYVYWQILVVSFRDTIEDFRYAGGV